MRQRAGLSVSLSEFPPARVELPLWPRLLVGQQAQALAPKFIGWFFFPPNPFKAPLCPQRRVCISCFIHVEENQPRASLSWQELCPDRSDGGFLPSCLCCAHQVLKFLPWCSLPTPKTLSSRKGIFFITQMCSCWPLLRTPWDKPGIPF